MIIRYGVRLIIAFSFSLGMALLLLQHCPMVQDYIAHKVINQLEKEWGVAINYQSSSLNFFSQTLTCSSGVIKSLQQGNFWWTFHQCRIKILLLRSIMKQKVLLSIELNELTSYSQTSNDKCDIIEHLQTIVSDQNQIVRIKPWSIVLKDIDCVIDHNNILWRTAIKGSCKFYKGITSGKKNGWQGSLALTKTTFYRNECAIGTLEKSSLKFFKDKHTPSPDLVGSGLITLGTESNRQHYQYDIANSPDYFKASLNNQKNQSLFLIKGTKNNYTGSVKINQQDINACLSVLGIKTDYVSNLSGNLSAWFAAQKDEKGKSRTQKLRIEGTNIQWNHDPIGKFSCNVTQSNSKPYFGNLVCNGAGGCEYKGIMKYDAVDNTGHLVVKNSTTLSFTTNSLSQARQKVIIFEPLSCRASLECKQDGRWLGEIKCSFADKLSRKENRCEGRLSLHHQLFDIDIRSSWGDALLCSGKINPFLHLTTFNIKRNNAIVLDCATSEDEKTLDGTCHYLFMKSFLPFETQRNIAGDNVVFKISLEQPVFPVLRGTLTMDAGHFYLPENRTLISSCGVSSFAFDIRNRSCNFFDAFGKFGKGGIQIPYATLRLNEYYAIKDLFIACQINNLFVNWKREAYGLIYGNCLLSKRASQPYTFFGDIIIKRALIKDNVFVQDSGTSLWSVQKDQDNLAHAHVDCSLTTENPIKVSMPHLDASVHCNVTLKRGQSMIPYGVGTISIDGGTIKFFRHNLAIEYGRVQLFTYMFQEPLVDIIARNRINKYMITLQITGSLKKPTVILESTPELSEEQIISLLLSGSDQATLQADLPAMLLQNVSNFIWGNKAPLSKHSTFFEQLTRPLRYVQITPNFTDQSGRGGIRGIVSIDLSEQLHAQIQKNFNLQEDFSFYIQYQITDDISIKAIKDQRGDVGSELEVRLKL